MTRPIPHTIINALTAQLEHGPTPGWQHHAACHGKPTRIFYPDQHGDTTAPKRICRDCPVRIDCLTHALTLPERYGLWGGYGMRTRTTISRQLHIRTQSDAA